jgi:hypothetical protein
MARYKEEIKKKVKNGVKDSYKHGLLHSKVLNHGLSQKEKIEFVKQVLKDHENLDLSKYKPFIHQFEEYSNQVFDFDTIFTKKMEELDQPAYMSPAKSLQARE